MMTDPITSLQMQTGSGTLRDTEQRGFLKCQGLRDFQETSPARSEKPNLPCDLLQSPNPAFITGPPS